MTMTTETDGRLLAMAAERRTNSDSEEAAWIARAQTGDEAAFRWLLERHRAGTVRLATQVLGRPDEAEDAAQDAFIRAFQNIGSFRGDARFSAWLYHIVVRACTDRRRRKWWSAEAPENEWLAAPETDTDTRIVVGQLLERLSPPVRAALVLRELDGLEYEEIASVLGIPVGTVRSRLSTARAKFRDLWTEAMREVEDV